MFENRRYLIIPSASIADVNFNEVLESGPDHLRYSLDGSKTFVKYEIRIVEEDIVSTYEDLETGEEKTSTLFAGTYGRPSIYNEGDTEYTHAEILEVLAGEEWTSPIDELMTE